MGGRSLRQCGALSLSNQSQSCVHGGCAGSQSPGTSARGWEQDHAGQTQTREGACSPPKPDMTSQDNVQTYPRPMCN